MNERRLGSNVFGREKFKRLFPPDIDTLEGCRGIWWRELRDITGSGSCARCYTERRDGQRKMILLLLRLILEAQKDDPFALNFLACHLLGEGKYDQEREAMQGFLDAAHLGLPLAWFNLGIFFASGIDGEKNYKRAVECFQHGKELGCSFCGNRLRMLES